jgi:NAD(P)-dependent dehydrogenase (short-subunit alcohol dehydrogenase family)
MALERLRLDGQVAIVTGAGRGVGRGIATVLAEAGALVVGTARQPEELADTIATIERAGGKGLAITGDATVRADVDRVVETAMERFGRIDILVNNVGGTTFSPVLDLTEEDFKYHFDWNCTSAFLMSQAAARHMIAAGSGSIVNISSGAGHFGIRGMAGYCTAKAALESLTRAMAQELAPKVRVNAIAMGTIYTPLMQKTYDLHAGTREALLALTPLHREGDPEDVGLAVLYLCSRGCYATSAIFHIDGGLETSSLPFPLPDL